jgi:hypothetical protein
MELIDGGGAANDVKRILHCLHQPAFHFAFILPLERGNPLIYNSFVGYLSS